MINRLSRLREARAKNESGFTLIELLVVVVIIGVLIAIAIPLYLNYTKGAKDKSAQSDLRNAISVMEVCNSDNGAYPTALGTAVGSTYPTLTGCANQTVVFSSGTTLTYGINTTGGGYTLHSTNSGGTSKIYCYNSATGGSISTVATATTAC